MRELQKKTGYAFIPREWWIVRSVQNVVKHAHDSTGLHSLTYVEECLLLVRVRRKALAAQTKAICDALPGKKKRIFCKHMYRNSSAPIFVQRMQGLNALS